MDVIFQMTVAVIGSDLLLEATCVSFKFADKPSPHRIQKQYILALTSLNAETAVIYHIYAYF
jgi:hypothetical protein